MIRAPRALVITDPAYDDDRITHVVDVAARVFHETLGPAHFGVQIRAKSRARSEVAALASRLRTITRAHAASLVINGDIDLARAVAADGVHLGRDACSVIEARAALGDAAWISIAAHDDDDVHRGVREGANAILVSPIFDTNSGGAPKHARGLVAIEHARAIAADDVAIFALGGVTAPRVASCITAGAHGIAAIGLFFVATDLEAHARGLAGAFASVCYPPAPMASYDETLQITSDIFKTHIDLDRGVLPNDHLQNDLGLDSLGVMEVVADIEDRFNLTIPNEMLTSVATVEDVARALTKLRDSAAAREAI